MTNWRLLAQGVALSALTAGFAVPAMAQETTSGLRGYVLNPDGTAAPGATVTLTDTRTGLTRTTNAADTGAFDFRNLNVGGPYTVAAAAPNQQPIQVGDITLALGSSADVNLQFTGDASVQQAIIVTGAVNNVVQVAIGPSSQFSLDDLQSEPAINRDLKDIIRADPRIYIDETAGGTAGTDGVQCGGASARFNSLTVDGIGLNDGFGLNSNGYPTERMPFPYDAIANVSVELAPFDVQYGGFTACNINAVTKSGTNRFSGSLFFDYTDNNLRGDKIEGRDVFVPEFDERRYGGTFGGPIIEDRLFFFGAYEKVEGVNLFARGPEGSGATNIITGFTQAIYDQIVNTARTVYGINDLGGTINSDPAEDEKYLARLDWNINDRHRAALTYNHNTGLNLTESDSNQVTQFEFGNHLYDRGAELNAYSGQLFSDWTDNLSTELRISFNDVDFTQQCRDGGNIGEVQITVAPSRTVFFGCDDSRHANALDYTVFGVKAAANYTWNDHFLTVGGERLEYDIFNQFVQHTEGEFIFPSLQAFIEGNPSNIFYGNAQGTNNPTDAAATFGYAINTVYAQDEFSVTPNINITLGARYDWYESSDSPRANPFFLARNGFSNTENLDGKGVFQPRFGFDWDATDRLSVRGGAGLYSGGNPNVWVSNSYSNDGLTNLQFEARNPLATGFPLALNILNTPNRADERGSGQTVNPNGALWGIPAYLFDAVASGSANSTVNAIDPDFEPASEWKFAIGATYFADLGRFGDDYRVDLDFLRSQAKSASTVIDTALERVGTAPGGAPLYKRVDRSVAACNDAATVNTAACPTRSANDFLLTNTEGGFSNIWSLGLSKDYDWGFDWQFGYAFTDAKDIRSMTSSVAFSNWTSIAVTDINNPSLANSNFEIPHRFTLRLGYEREWFDDFTTRISLFGSAFKSRSFSYNFAAGGLNDTFGDGQESLHLLYVPTGPNDPNVFFCGGAAQASPLCRVSTTGAGATQFRSFDTTGFFNFVDAVGLQRGAFTSRNGQEGQWTNKFDLRVEQEFPTGFGVGSVFAVVENIGNLLNDEWGVVYEASFPQQARIVEVDRDPATNRYVYRQLARVTPENPVNSVSFWTVRLGVNWEF
jgi:outer membrane receptor for ferrienterochelin and colicin